MWLNILFGFKGILQAVSHTFNFEMIAVNQPISKHSSQPPVKSHTVNWICIGDILNKLFGKDHHHGFFYTFS